MGSGIWGIWGLGFGIWGQFEICNVSTSERTAFAIIQVRGENVILTVWAKMSLFFEFFKFRNDAPSLQRFGIISQNSESSANLKESSVSSDKLR